MATDFLQSNTASRQGKILTAMQEMTWLTESQKEYLYSTIYKSTYPS